MATKKKQPPKKLAAPQIITPEEKATQLVQAFQPQTKLFSRWSKVNKLTTEDQYEDSGSALRACRDLIKAAEDERKELVGPLKAVAKKIDQKFKAITDPLKKYADEIEDLRRDYFLEKRRAEQKRIEAQAKRAEKRGDEQFAEDLREKAAVVKPVNANTEDMKTATVWKAVVKDEKALVRAWLNGEVDDNLVVINTQVLNAIARSKKSIDLGIPGVEGFADVSFR